MERRENGIEHGELHSQLFILCKSEIFIIYVNSNV